MRHLSACGKLSECPLNFIFALRFGTAFQPWLTIPSRPTRQPNFTFSITMSYIPEIGMADIVGLLRPLDQAIIRRAGSQGTGAFREVVARWMAPLYAKIDGDVVPAAFGGQDLIPVLGVSVSALLQRGMIHDTGYEGKPPLNLSALGGLRCEHLVVSGGSLVRCLGEVEPANTLVQTVTFDESFCRVTSISDSLLASCVRLERVDLSNLPLVKSVGGYCLYECPLTRVDLSHMTRLETIGPFFLANAKRLQGLDLPVGGSITNIGQQFLFRCSSLTQFNFAALSSVSVIPSGFLGGCASMSSADLSPMAHITEVDTGFFAGATSLAMLDLAPLHRLEKIPGRFLSSCASLKRIDFGPLSNVTAIDSRFLSGCATMEAVDLRPLTNLQTIGERFLAACTDVAELKFFEGAVFLGEELPSGFLLGCNRLTQVDLGPFRHVTSVGTDFLSQCSKLESADLAPLSNVVRIGGSFMFKCISLRTLDTAPLSNVERVGEFFLGFCTALFASGETSFLAHMGKATFFPRGFLEGCPNADELKQAVMLEDLPERPFRTWH